MSDTEFSYEIVQDGMVVASASGAGALREIEHYARQYEQDGPIEVYEVTRRLLHAVPAQLAAAPVAAQEPFGWYFQHSETGRTTVIDQWQVDNGWERGNDRWQKIGPVYLGKPVAAQGERQPKEYCEAGVKCRCGGGSLEVKRSCVMWNPR